MPKRKPKTTAHATPIGLAERAIAFIERLTLVGDYSGRPFVLREWQKDIVRGIFGPTLPDGRRRIRRVFIALPRKQAKSTLIAGIALFLLLGQGKSHQAIYCASASTKQASLIFDTARQMIEADPTLGRLVTAYPGYRKLVVEATGSKMEVLSSSAGGPHGLSPTAVLIDEMHLVDKPLVDALTSGFGARLEPLTIAITTAGHDRFSPCFQEWDYAAKVRDGVIDDPTYLPVIYAADPGDDWTDEAVWHKAMPALGDFCQLDYVRDLCRRAKDMPSEENAFRQLQLNQWTEAANRWLSMDRWSKCRPPLSDAELVGRPSYCGLDIGITGDMSAFVMAFPRGDGGFDLKCRFWVPEQGTWREERRNADLYELWHRQGFLAFTGAETQDTSVIKAEIVRLNEVHPIKSLFADRAYASQLLSELFNDHGIPVKGIPQGPLTLNEPMVKLEELVISGKLGHGNHPALMYCASNADVSRNSTGLMHLDKSSSTARIDGLAATVDAIAAALADGGGQTAVRPSVYEHRGMRFL